MGNKNDKFAQWSFVIDEQNAIVSPKLSTWGEGRYVFQLGNKKIYTNEEENYYSFEMDLIDLCLGTKDRYIIKDLQHIFYVVGFYALSPSCVVIVDYDENQLMIKQTAIVLEASTLYGTYFVERTYCVASRIAFFFLNCVVGEHHCIIYSPPTTSPRNNFCCHLIPLIPWSQSQDKDLSNVVDRMNASIRLSMPGTSLSRWESPFFSSESEICFFMDGYSSICPDPFSIAILDLNVGDFRVVSCQPDPNTGFPSDKYGQMPIDSHAVHSNDGQVSLLTTYPRHRNGFHFIAARFLQWCARKMWRGFYISVNIRFNWLAALFLQSALLFTSVKTRLLRNPRAKIGVLQTRSWQWIEVQNEIDDYYWTDMTVFKDGQTLIHHLDRDESEEHYIVLRSPFQVARLKALAELHCRPAVYSQSREQLLRRL